MNFKQMRKKLAYWGIAAPESDEELGARWDYYTRRIRCKIEKKQSDITFALSGKRGANTNLK